VVPRHYPHHYSRSVTTFSTMVLFIGTIRKGHEGPRRRPRQRPRSPTATTTPICTVLKAKTAPSPSPSTTGTPTTPHRKAPSSSLPPPPPVLRRKAQSSTRIEERKEKRKQQRGTTERKENGQKTSRSRQEIIARPCATYDGLRHTLMSTSSHPSNTICSEQPPPHPLTKERHFPPHILHPRRKSTLRHRWANQHGKEEAAKRRR